MNLWVRTHPSLKTSSWLTLVGLSAEIGTTHAGSSLRACQNDRDERRRKREHVAGGRKVGAWEREEVMEEEDESEEEMGGGRIWGKEGEEEM